MALHYLTVQDILWINLQVTKKVHRFNYARLEEATYYQYAYGESKSLLPQAARFLSGFLKMAPIEEANEATAFVATLAFLRLNGCEIALCDDAAAAWFEDVRSGRKKAREAIEAIAKRSGVERHEEGVPNVRATILDILSDYCVTASSLAGRSPIAA